jgi:hypothetical protein
MSPLKDEVAEALSAQQAPDGSKELWEEIYAGYEEGGPDAVWNLLEKKVKIIRKAAKAETSEMRAAAGVAKRKRPSRKRR